MDYFPPKTLIDFHLGPPRSQSTWRQGWFKIDLINNNSNDHHYWVSLSHKEHKWQFKIWGGKNHQFSLEIGNYATEKDAAKALDKHCASMQETLLLPHLQELEERVSVVKSKIKLLQDTGMSQEDIDYCAQCD